MKRIVCIIAVFSLLVLPSVFGGDLTMQGTATGSALDCGDQTDMPVFFNDNGDDHPWDIDTPTDPDSLFAIPNDTNSPMEQSVMKETFGPDTNGPVESTVINRNTLDMVLVLMSLALR